MRYWFGEKIRAVRERKGFTLKDVAEKAGVSESLVSQVERNRVSPAIDTLLSLADVLDVDLEYLFSDYKRERLVRITRKDERDTFTRPGVLYERLAQLESSKHQDGIESYYITIEAGQENKSTEYGHPGWELGVVVEGNATLTIGKESYELAPGDSVSFRSDAPHVISNPGKTPLKILWVITPPK
ncbi:MAG: XRE family transcriptional regulator [Treponema sp.]|jgi:transcriptional regulator with XRE-family HTH domain|nr:XRE family transcriptional regulator [Treponema sp.]